MDDRAQPDVKVPKVPSEPEPAPEPEADDDLPFVHFATISAPPKGERWLVEDVWPREATGILGGGAKLGKSMLTIEMAVAVASGTALFGVYAVQDPGPVLICSMEGQRWLAPDRLRKVARHRGVSDGTSLPIAVLDRARLRLDDPADLKRLVGAIKRRKPKLVILDPLVRFHTADENAAIGGISKVLDDLRWIQRTCKVCILVVHHNRKNVRRGDRPGVGLRGSTDIHAWGDVNWYLRDKGKSELSLAIEHRAAAAPDPIRLRLVGDDEHLRFDVLGDHDPGGECEPAADTVVERVTEALRGASDGLGFGELRVQLGIGAPAVSMALKALEVSGAAMKRGRLWVLRTVPGAAPGATPVRNAKPG